MVRVVNKREARKIALYWCAGQLHTAKARTTFTDSSGPEHERNERLVLAEVEGIADHLSWEADGRPGPLTPRR